MATADIKGYFTPKSVAVFGASGHPEKIGGRTLQNLLDFKSNVDIFPINPGYQKLMGLPCYPNLLEIPEHVDLVIIAVEGKKINEAIRQCLEKKVKHAVIFSSGFAETGEEGLHLQEELVELCKKADLRFTGPNTMGTMNFLNGIPLSFGRIGEYTLKGGVGLISQSGAYGTTIVEQSMDEKIGFSYFVSLGNQADLNTMDFMEYMVDEEETKVIGIYMESVKEAHRMKNAAHTALQNHKPVVVFKSGRSSLGQKAALSHTASMTGSDEAFRAFAERYGIVQVKDVKEFVNALKTFNRGKRPKGKRVAIISTSGASCIMYADNCTELGIELAMFSADTVKKIEGIMPDFGASQNPLDITAAAITQEGLFKRCMEIICEDEGVDLLIVDTTFSSELGLSVAKDIVELDHKTDTPIFTCFLGGNPVNKARKYLKEARIPTFNSHWETVESVKMLLDYEDSYTSQEGATLLINNQRNDETNWFEEVNSDFMTEPEVKKILSKHGISIPKGRVASSLDEVGTLSREMKFPMVAKVVSKDIPHKSDVGGVVLSINNEEELFTAYSRIMDNAKKNMPNAMIEGVLIEEMLQKSFLEVIVGIKNDPEFGPVVMCGLGGIYTEILADISHSLAPLNEAEALRMLQNLKGYPIFSGARGGRSYDVQALAKALVKISNLALSMGNRFTDLEVNPLVVLEDGKGVLALDGLITIDNQVAILN